VREGPVGQRAAKAKSRGEQQQPDPCTPQKNYNGVGAGASAAFRDVAMQTAPVAARA